MCQNLPEHFHLFWSWNSDVIYTNSFMNTFFINFYEHILHIICDQLLLNIAKITNEHCIFKRVIEHNRINLPVNLNWMYSCWIYKYMCVYAYLYIYEYAKVFYLYLFSLVIVYYCNCFEMKLVFFMVLVFTYGNKSGLYGRVCNNSICHC